ncbi:MAG: RDD family protein, partial [Desulfobacterales bacterium]
MNARNKTNSLTIKTPEGVEFSLSLAGPITRFLAWSVDLLVILVASKLLNVILGLVGLISQDFATAAGFIGFFLI